MVLINIWVDNIRDTDAPSPVFLDARVHEKLNLYARYNYSSVAEFIDEKILFVFSFCERNATKCKRDPIIFPMIVAIICCLLSIDL